MAVRTKRRLWYWRFVHYWSIVRLRRRVVMGSATLGLLTALRITAMTPEVFLSGVAIRINGMGADGDIAELRQPPRSYTNGDNFY